MWAFVQVHGTDSMDKANFTHPGSSTVPEGPKKLHDKQDKKGHISEGQLLEELPT